MVFVKKHRSVIGSFDGEEYSGGKKYRKPSLFVVTVLTVLKVGKKTCFRVKYTYA